jgi:hypothetical protein
MCTNYITVTLNSDGNNPNVKYLNEEQYLQHLTMCACDNMEKILQNENAKKIIIRAYEENLQELNRLKESNRLYLYDYGLIPITTAEELKSNISKLFMRNATILRGVDLESLKDTNKELYSVYIKAKERFEQSEKAKQKKKQAAAKAKKEKEIAKAKKVLGILNENT